MTPNLPIVSSRLFPVSPEELYAAFADPDRLALWWGPKDFRNTIREFDLRPGGKWLLTMHGPNGADYPNEKEFLEVIPGRKVSFHHVQPMHDFTMTLDFTPESGSTRLTWTMQFVNSPEEKLRAFILNANEENFDRLAAHLQPHPSQP